MSYNKMLQHLAVSDHPGSDDTIVEDFSKSYPQYKGLYVIIPSNLKNSFRTYITENMGSSVVSLLDEMLSVSTDPEDIEDRGDLIKSGLEDADKSLAEHLVDIFGSPELLVTSMVDSGYIYNSYDASIADSVNDDIEPTEQMVSRESILEKDLELSKHRNQELEQTVDSLKSELDSTKSELNKMVEKYAVDFIPDDAVNTVIELLDRIPLESIRDSVITILQEFGDDEDKYMSAAFITKLLSKLKDLGVISYE